MSLRVATGLNYLRVLRQLHLRIKPEWYLEIGTFKGDSLELSRARTVAIDPQFKVRSNVLRGKPQCIFLQDTSDAAFSSGVLDALKVRFDLAFLDGLHLYEYLLRDFMNAERYASPGAVCLMHDCLPPDTNMTVRDRSECRTPEWTGDVWKLLPILREYRPDLEVTALDAAPTGLVAVRNMDPTSTVLWDKYDEIRARFDDVDIESWGADRFTALADMQSAAEFTHLFGATAAPMPGFALKLAVPSPELGPPWGEHAFAEGLAAALRGIGHAARIDYIDDWQRTEPGEVAVAIRGHGFRRKVFLPAAGQTALMWNIYPAWPPLTEGEIDAFDHVWIASAPEETRLRARSKSVMPQAFDARRMKPVESPLGEKPVFVANNYERGGRVRPMAQWIIDAGLEVAVWGRGWEGTPLAPFVVAEHVANEELGAIYANARAVLNDHANGMAQTGYVSNRVFDALACGVPVISDRVVWLPDGMADMVEQVGDAEELAAAVARVSAEDASRRAERRAYAHTLPDMHSFDARAAEIASMACTVLTGGKQKVPA